MKPSDLTAQVARDQIPQERQGVAKKQTRYEYKKGPMLYLGQQIVRAMHDAGYPAKIHTCLRSGPEQERLFKAKRSKARAFQSPHQYSEAVDIIHPSKGWEVSQEYWDTLNACAKVVARKFGVEFEYGYDWGWDMAHIELKDWRTVQERVGRRHPEQWDLYQRFQEVLPKVWKDYRQRKLAAGNPDPASK